MEWHIQDFVFYWDKRIKAAVTVMDIFQVTVTWVVRLCSFEDGYRFLDSKLSPFSEGCMLSSW
jgi:hypothetical protein